MALVVGGRVIARPLATGCGGAVSPAARGSGATPVPLDQAEQIAIRKLHEIGAVLAERNADAIFLPVRRARLKLEGALRQRLMDFIYGRGRGLVASRNEAGLQYRLSGGRERLVEEIPGLLDLYLRLTLHRRQGTQRRHVVTRRATVQLVARVYKNLEAHRLLLKGRNLPFNFNDLVDCLLYVVGSHKNKPRLIDEECSNWGRNPQDFGQEPFWVRTA